MYVTQTPEPGRHHLLHNGDILEFKIETYPPVRGTAFLRTNIGNAAVRRTETISLIRTGYASAGQDWHDIAMEPAGNGTYILRLALTEAGHFEAKAYIVPADSAEAVWPSGDNVHINISPAEYCSSNSIYCAFVRQFGPNKSLKKSVDINDKAADFDHEGYTVIPSSGTFRDLIKELDHIFYKLKCRILHLLPINPTPTTYARMGRFGSPYASTDFLSVDPALAEFDRNATPLQQFFELVDAVHVRSGRIFIDIAVNHTGWASRIHTEHPEWLKHEPDGSIKSPGAWGTVWADLTELDYNNHELWKYIANVFLTWCQRGVDGFRCDAGYMIPVPAWEYIIAEVRNEYPNTVFLLEGLGGDPAVTARLLDFANMNWAYSELFQNYSKGQIEGYLRYAWNQSMGDGLMVHYAETHDNLRLASNSETYAKMRTGLCALSSINGAFGFANGVEWFATEKIDVHEARALNWGSEHNQIDFIARLNTILQKHPAFHNDATLELVESNSPDVVLIKRTSFRTEYYVLVAVNLNCEHESTVTFKSIQFPHQGNTAIDLIDFTIYETIPDGRNLITLTLKPGAVHCFCYDKTVIESVRQAGTIEFDRLSKTEFQKARQMALVSLCSLRKSNVLRANESPAELASQLLESPENFLKKIVDAEDEIPYVIWQWPDDFRRVVMIPPGRSLLVLSPVRFRATLSANDHNIRQFDSLMDAQGRHFAVFEPVVAESLHLHATLKIHTGDGQAKLRRSEAQLLFLAPDIKLTPSTYNHDEILSTPLIHLQSNGRGAISHLRLDMPNVSSRYDAVLLANINTEHPEDRHIMFRRLRIWMAYHARTQEVSSNCLNSFDIAKDGSGLWNYRIPAGNGLYVSVILKIQLVTNRNAVRISMLRLEHPGKRKILPAECPVKFILRLDLEDRNFHYETKAQGVEHYWPGCVSNNGKNMVFAPAPDRKMEFTASAGRFVRNDEWIYNLWQKNEADRGLDPNTDLYSPGYFEFALCSNESYQLVATMLTPQEPEKLYPLPVTPLDFRKRSNISVPIALLNAMRAFVVKRDDLKTVIAGYPWFLDWGRDTLIAARGLVVVREFRNDVKKILCQFAKYAEHGTIPNIIHGNVVGNRDTSDAPLWLFTAVSDLCKAEGNFDFLNIKVRDDMTLRQTLEGIVRDIRKGTPNGIIMDPGSGLVFSPPHFTWMDTNYPAGTPREGYPIEIQALWFAALKFMSTLPDADPEMGKLAQLVQASINQLFRSDDGKYLSDCLHCCKGTPAEKAVKDDHIRPNQLYAITLGAVTDKTFCRSILETCNILLLPGAIRSLADRPVKYPLPVRIGDRLLNDPYRPYQGHYAGDEDTCRKMAYHNGTAWTWQFPAYCEAYIMTYGELGKTTARAILSTAENLFHTGCVSQVPEIIDGDWPHTPRGCDAQAWGITEITRVGSLMV